MICPKRRLLVFITGPERVLRERLGLPNQNSVPERFNLVLAPFERVQDGLKSPELAVEKFGADPAPSISPAEIRGATSAL